MSCLLVALFFAVTTGGDIFFFSVKKKQKASGGTAQPVHWGCGAVPPKTPLGLRTQRLAASQLGMPSNRLAGANRKLHRCLSVGTLHLRRATGKAL